MPISSPYLRTIKSFALREGRLTPRQKNALEAEWAHYMLPTDAVIDWDKTFQEHAPIVLEIGFGMGNSLLKNALSQPDYHFVGIEVYRPGIGALLAELKTQQIENVRLFYGDAVEILNHCVPNNSLDTVQIFFADPWPKRRHHKRRLIQIPFVKLVAQKLKATGKLHLATDWEDYAVHMKRVLSSLEELTPVTEPNLFAQYKEKRPATKYEQRGQKLGHDVWDLVFEKT